MEEDNGAEMKVEKMREKRGQRKRKGRGGVRRGAAEGLVEGSLTSLEQFPDRILKQDRLNKVFACVRKTVLCVCPCVCPYSCQRV